MPVPQLLFPATRAAGLETLADFIPRAGRDYARDRNHDTGPPRENVSTLSPYLRHRLVTEQETVMAVLDRHSLSAAEKFVQEVFWRTYWKGWLERHPATWHRYRTDLLELDRSADYTAAVSGSTGIDAMDAWVGELIETGYLHNHVRMWFASIWVFTLGLPWQLGADFFYRHLLDGDAASNTLSWRWVAGLQTRGKTYLATAQNISRYTDGRFSPRGLATTARALSDEPAPAVAIAEVAPLPYGGRLGILLHEEDLDLGSLVAEHPTLRSAVAVSGGADVDTRSALPVGDQVREFTRTALSDGLERARSALKTSSDTAAEERRVTAEDVVEWAVRERLDSVAVPYAPVGPVADRLIDVERALRAQSIALVPVRREWDSRAWPYASRGFFPFREKIPGLVRHLGGMGSLPPTP